MTTLERNTTDPLFYSESVVLNHILIYGCRTLNYLKMGILFFRFCAGSRESSNGKIKNSRVVLYYPIYGGIKLWLLRN